MKLTLPPTLAGIGPLGTPELIILAVLFLGVVVVVGGIILFVILANKKK